MKPLVACRSRVLEPHSPPGGLIGESKTDQNKPSRTTAGFAALLDAHQIGDPGAADKCECAHRPPGVNVTGKAAPLDPRG